jgi:DHA1 family bicyclomycin/chloramphenicol resistance-like MFS transporter
MQIRPTSFGFTLLLGLLAAVPYSGIDINLPALAAKFAGQRRRSRSRQC